MTDPQYSDDFDFIQGPGCAQYPTGEVMPTQEEIDGLALADFSDHDNVRKLARIIAAKNSMEQAAKLTGELSYAYQHQAYDADSGGASIAGLGTSGGHQELLAALRGLTLSPAASDQLDLLIGMVESVIRIESEIDKPAGADTEG